MWISKKHSVALTVLFMTGCGLMEPLVEVPNSYSTATVSPYELSLYDESIHLFTPVPLSKKMEDKKLTRRIENLLVLVDSSGTDKSYRGIPDAIYQRELFRRFNRSMPRFALRGGVWQLGDPPVPEVIASYLPHNIESDLNSGDDLPRIGSTDLVGAIDKATEMAARLKGRTALVLFTRWEHLTVEVENAVKRYYQRGQAEIGFNIVPSVDDWLGGDNTFCFYAIGTGNSMSRSKLDQVDKCGGSEGSEKLMQPRAMSHFVETILFTGPADSDQDGIYDYEDTCPGTPVGTLIGFDGCAMFKNSGYEE